MARPLICIHRQHRSSSRGLRRAPRRGIDPTAPSTAGHMGDKPWLQPIPRDGGAGGGGDVRCPTCMRCAILRACLPHICKSLISAGHALTPAPCGAGRVRRLQARGLLPCDVQVLARREAGLRGGRRRHSRLHQRRQCGASHTAPGGPVHGTDRPGRQHVRPEHGLRPLWQVHLRFPLRPDDAAR